MGTLFTLGDTNEVVESFLGVKIEQIITSNVLDLQTYLQPRALISNILFLIVLTLIKHIHIACHSFCHVIYVYIANIIGANTEP